MWKSRCGGRQRDKSMKTHRFGASLDEKHWCYHCELENKGEINGGVRMKCLNLNTVSSMALRGQKYPARKKGVVPSSTRAEMETKGRHFRQSATALVCSPLPSLWCQSSAGAISVHFLLDFMTRLCSMFFLKDPTGNLRVGPLSYSLFLITRS